ncbi:MAG: glycyl-radical enzyme activating protein [Clostridia bacterium]|nr:glycyl-radical enzyme activating protein [Clostridia bacterium]
MGTITDIERFSLNDGPGIRTTVFFKGCPLNCIWCHNPESKSPRPQLSYNAEACVGCGKCAEVCPNGVHSFAEGVHAVAFSGCGACGKCVGVCPAKALKTYGCEASAEDVMRVVLRDRAYYETSGGGLTVSGGEPTFQFAFLKELLTLAKREGVHTAVETCGFAPTERFAELLPLCDLFLYDHKAPTELHEKLTGVPDDLIVKNLAFLLDGGANVILRCPVIDGVNGTAEQRNAFAARFPKLLAVEELPYHDLGRTKAKRIGVDYPDFK